MCEILLKNTKGKVFFIVSSLVTKSGFITTILNAKKSLVRSGEAAPSKKKANIHGSKLMLSIWWDQEGVIFNEVLKQPETITADRYRQQMVKLDPAVKDKRS